MNIGDLVRKYGEGSIFSMSDGGVVHGVETVSTGSYMLDLALGGGEMLGGLPVGRISLFAGNPGSGKTTLALSSIVSAQRAGMTCVYFDAEYALDVEYAERIGVSTDGMYISQPSTAEQCLDMMYDIVRSEERCMVVMDSIAALTPVREMGGESGDAHVGLVARLLSQHMRRIARHVHVNRHVVLMINQYRSNITGMVYGKTKVLPGGKAQEYFASVIVDLARVGSLKSGGEEVGIEVGAKVVKNKIARPFQRASIPILFGAGVDRGMELVDLAMAAGLIVKSGSWYRTKDGETVGQGRSACSEWALSHTEEILEAFRVRLG